MPPFYALSFDLCWLTCPSNSSWGHLHPTPAALYHRVLISHHPGWPIHPDVPSTAQEFLGYSTEKSHFLGHSSVSGKSMGYSACCSHLRVSVSGAHSGPRSPIQPHPGGLSIAQGLVRNANYWALPWSTEAETGGVIACYPTQNLCFHKLSRWFQGTGKLRSYASKQVVTSDPSVFFCLQRFWESCTRVTSWSDKLTMARWSWW